VLPAQVGVLTDVFGGGRVAGWSQANRPILMLLGAQAMVSLLTYARRRLESALGIAMFQGLVSELYRRVMRFPPSFFLDKDPEALNGKLLDEADAAAKVAHQALLTLPLALLSGIVLSTIMVRQNVFLGLCMIPLALLAGYPALLESRRRPASAGKTAETDSIRGCVREIVAGVAEIRAHAAFDHFQGRLQSALDRWAASARRGSHLPALHQALDLFVGVLQTGILYWVGAGLCVTGSWISGLGGPLSWGGVMQFMVLVFYLQRPVSEVSAFLFLGRLHRNALRSIAGMLDRPDGTGSTGAPADPAAEARAVSLQAARAVAPSGAVLLESVDLDVAPGRHLVVTGPAGGGKSSLLSLLAGALQPASGTALVEGRSAADLHPGELAPRIGWVPQDPVLFKGSLRSNLLLGLRRPSPGALRDAEGPLDVRSLGGVRTPADLDERLLLALRQADLERDVLEKALDSRPGHADAIPELETRLPKLRDEIRARWESTAGVPRLIRFDPETLFPGTLGENLFGPGEDGDPALLERHANPEDLDALLCAGRVPADPADRRAALRSALALPVARDSGWGSLPLHPGRILALRTALQRTGSGGSPGLSIRDRLLGGRLAGGTGAELARGTELLAGLLKEFGLLTRLLLHGLEVQVGDEGRALSAGQRQKVALARTFLKSPRLLLLDEATSDLDPGARSRIQATIRSEFRDRTVLAATHRPEEARPGDRVVVLDRGRLAEDGRSRDLPGSNTGASTVGDPLLELRRRLSLCPLFQGLRSGLLSRLALSCRFVRVPPATFLFRAGEPGSELYVILEGEVEFVRGDGALVHTFGQGSAFGELALFHDGVRTLGARSRGECVLALLGRQDLMDLIRAEPDIAVGLLGNVSRRMAQITES
jgi:ABC-type multidrug transport system fused ATPase/permease subunit